MKTILSTIETHCKRILDAPKFFWLIIGLFALSALWVATASAYPMAFDEDFHLGIIKIYAAHPSPFGLIPTREMAQFGNVPYDPSYLYHFLFGPLYNLAQGLHFSSIGTIIFLRFVNIGLFLGAVVMTKKVLAQLGATQVMQNSLIALWLLIPIMSQLAGQINYDNLFLLEVATTFWLSLRILRSLTKKHQLPARELWLLGIVCLLSAVTKYAFLPIAFGILLVIFIVMLRQRRGFWTLIGQSFQEFWHTRWLIKALLIGSLGVSLILSSRYVTDILQFRSVTPSCDETFMVSDCMAYGPYERDELLAQNISSDFTPLDPVSYVGVHWIPGMMNRLFFAVAGASNDFDTQPPLTIPIMLYSIFGVIVFIGIGLAMWQRKLSSAEWLVLSAFFVYGLALIVQLYQSYRHTGEPVAINGRYLLPLLPLVGYVPLRYFSSLQLYRRIVRPQAAIIAVVMLVLAVSQGGILTYIVRSQQNWYWPGWGQQSHTVLKTIVDSITLKL